MPMPITPSVTKKIALRTVSIIEQISNYKFTFSYFVFNRLLHGQGLPPIRSVLAASFCAAPKVNNESCNDGLGTDEKALISALGRRNAVQRKLIGQAYEEHCKENLIKRLEGGSQRAYEGGN
ncbi:hypothetical protein IFM89_026178 [Coptis chinensis]|uniref:Uncharacterized protein n=1 Tax=Coptis chinensis TaxID=261450 RepID=A0A835LGK1_9MAGN|nr:hypothetical protein IFM89_026178 [Coptis chinensis]